MGISPLYSFSRKYRIKSSEVGLLYKQSTRRSYSHFQLLFCPNSLPNSRLLISFRRHWGSAVQRNLLKRRMIHLFRTTRKNWMPGYDFTFIFSKKIVSWTDLTQQVIIALKGARLWSI